MNMLLDKIKTAGMSLSIGSLAMAIVSLFSFHYFANQHQVKLGGVWQFAYLNPLRDWPFELAMYALLAIGSGLIISGVFFWLERDRRWRTGPRDLHGDYAAADLLAESATESPRIFAGGYKGRPFYAGEEDRAMVIGPPKSGKTVFLLNQLLKATDQALSFVVIDFKPEIFEIIGKPLAERGYRVLRINPTEVDEAANHWNPLEDLDAKSESGVAEICAAFLPIDTSSDTPFVGAQRDWFAAAIFHVLSQPGGNLPAAYKLMTSESDPERLLDVLSNSTSEPCVRIAQRIKMGSSGLKPDHLIMAGLSQAARKLSFLALPGVAHSLGWSDFSVRDELGKGDKPTALFIQFKETESETFASVLTVLISRILSTLIETYKERKPLAIFLDEVGLMPPIPDLTGKLNSIRSRHMPTWLYFQAVEQLEKKYGKGAKDLFFTACDVQICFRLQDDSSRRLFSDLIGTTERERHSTSVSYGANGHTSKTTSVETVKVIEPHEIGQLKKGEVICLYRGAAARGKATPYFVDFPEFRRKMS